MRRRVVAWASAVKRDPALHTGASAVGKDRVEVVEGPARLEHIDIVGRPPYGEHVDPGCFLRRGLESEAHEPTLRPASHRPYRRRLSPREQVGWL